MMFCDAQLLAIGIAQKLVLVRELQPRVDVIPIEKVEGRFSHVAIQVEDLAVVTFMISTPDQTRSPVSSFEPPVVTDRRRGPTNVARLQRFGIPQETVTHLH